MWDFLLWHSAWQRHALPLVKTEQNKNKMVLLSESLSVLSRRPITAEGLVFTHRYIAKFCFSA